MNDNYFDCEEYSKIDFIKTKIKKGDYDNCTFLNCNLEAIDFRETVLNGSVFDNCNCKNTTFDRSNLENSDFRTANSFTINPAENRLKKAYFSKENVVGLLTAYNINIE